MPQYEPPFIVKIIFKSITRRPMLSVRLVIMNLWLDLYSDKAKPTDIWFRNREKLNIRFSIHSYNLRVNLPSTLF